MMRSIALGFLAWLALCGAAESFESEHFDDVSTAVQESMAVVQDAAEIAKELLGNAAEILIEGIWEAFPPKDVDSNDVGRLCTFGKDKCWLSFPYGEDRTVMEEVEQIITDFATCKARGGEESCRIDSMCAWDGTRCLPSAVVNGTWIDECSGELKWITDSLKDDLECSEAMNSTSCGENIQCTWIGDDGLCKLDMLQALTSDITKSTASVKEAFNEHTANRIANLETFSRDSFLLEDLNSEQIRAFWRPSALWCSEPSAKEHCKLVGLSVDVAFREDLACQKETDCPDKCATTGSGSDSKCGISEEQVKHLLKIEIQKMVKEGLRDDTARIDVLEMLFGCGNKSSVECTMDCAVKDLTCSIKSSWVSKELQKQAKSGGVCGVISRIMSADCSDLDVEECRNKSKQCSWTSDNSGGECKVSVSHVLNSITQVKNRRGKFGGLRRAHNTCQGHRSRGECLDDDEDP